jgi:hypothetical protein
LPYLFPDIFKETISYISHDDMGTLPGEHGGNGSANTTGASCNNGDFISNIHS